MQKRLKKILTSILSLGLAITLATSPVITMAESAGGHPVLVL